MAQTNELSRIDTQLSSRPLPKEDVAELAGLIERYYVPLIASLQRELNETLRRPRVPTYSDAPITDSVVDPGGEDPPLDGMMAIGGDNQLYVRIGGSWTVV